MVLKLHLLLTHHKIQKKTIKKYMKDIAKKNNWICIYQIDIQTDTMYMIYCLTENINYPPNAEIRVTIDP